MCFVCSKHGDKYTVFCVSGVRQNGKVRVREVRGLAPRLKASQSQLLCVFWFVVLRVLVWRCHDVYVWIGCDLSQAYRALAVKPWEGSAYSSCPEKLRLRYKTNVAVFGFIPQRPISADAISWDGGSKFQAISRGPSFQALSREILLATLRHHHQAHARAIFIHPAEGPPPCWFGS